MPMKYEKLAIISRTTNPTIIDHSTISVRVNRRTDMIIEGITKVIKGMNCLTVYVIFLFTKLEFPSSGNTELLLLLFLLKIVNR